MTTKNLQNTLSTIKPQFDKIDNELSETDTKIIDNNLNKYVLSEAIAKKDSADSFFKNIVDKLYNKEDVELKTEYTNVEEVFTGSKIDFICTHCGVPSANSFLHSRENKMVSLERKSRQEIIMGLWRREEEIRNQEREALNKELHLS